MAPRTPRSSASPEWSSWTGTQVRAQVDSPTFLGGLWDRRRGRHAAPGQARLGAEAACLGLGVRIHEHTRALGLGPAGAGMAVRTPYGRVFARRVALGTNIFPSLVGGCARTPSRCTTTR